MTGGRSVCDQMRSMRTTSFRRMVKYATAMPWGFIWFLECEENRGDARHAREANRAISSISRESIGACNEADYDFHTFYFIRLTNISSSRLDLLRMFAMRMPLVVAISSRLFTVSPGDSVASNVFSSMRMGVNF